ncbi:hypothetical protein MRB53_028685 [Persea americana]|uniref:Uncharacterized protein n=1 Tax=Persea americana TaxID=3435 RepID=A0ACC2KGA9_PERAE|nr:hypothetical protein MRB53_028685 [Persea americana]
MRETEMQMMESDGDEEKKRWVLGDGRPLRWEVDGVRETSERAWDLPGGRWERFCVSPLDGNGERAHLISQVLELSPPTFSITQPISSPRRRTSSPSEADPRLPVQPSP